MQQAYAKTNLDYQLTYDKLQSCKRLEPIKKNPKAGIQAKGKGFNIQIAPTGTVTISYENKEAFEEAKNILEKYAIPLSNIHLDFYKGIIPDDLWGPDLDRDLEILEGERPNSVNGIMINILKDLKLHPHRINLIKEKQRLDCSQRLFKKAMIAFWRRGIRVDCDYKVRFDPSNLGHWSKLRKGDWKRKKAEDLEIYIVPEEHFKTQRITKHENIDIIKKFLEQHQNRTKKQRFGSSSS